MGSAVFPRTDAVPGNTCWTDDNGKVKNMDEMLEILRGIRPDVDFENEELLIDDGVLDSFDIIAIVSEFADAFNVDIDVSDLEPENFNTVDAMWALIERLSE